MRKRPIWKRPIVLAGMVAAVVATVLAAIVLRAPVSSDEPASLAKGAESSAPASHTESDFSFERVEVDGLLNRSELDSLVAPSGERMLDRILLITLDTVRADHLSSYGYPLPTTPFLDKLAEDGVRFENAYAAMATTAPSHATLLTGLYPVQHRVTRNGHVLDDAVLTLTETLSGMGFETAAFVATNQHFGPGNILQGFGTVDEPLDSELNLEGSYRSADQTLARAKDWFSKSAPAEKNFVWLHLFDAHTPYAARPEIRENALQISDPSVRERWENEVGEILMHNFDGAEGAEGDDENDDRVNRYLSYASEIRFADDTLREFFDAMRPYGIDDYLVVITADHGEGMGNHDWWGHGKHIYNEQVRVPLIMRWPDRRYQGVVEEVVELTDVMPTVLRAVGVPAEALRDRALPIEGTPLQALFSESGMRSDDSIIDFNSAFVQRRSFLVREHEKPSRSGSQRAEAGESFGLITRTHKLIHRTAIPDEFFDLQADPAELENLIDRSPVLYHEMRSELLSIVEELSSDASLPEKNMSDEDIERLRALGYLQ